MRQLIERRRDWAARLEAEFMAGRDRPFAWHDNDCGSAFCRWLEAMTGVNPFPRIAPRPYKTEIGAAGALKRFAGGGLIEAADKLAAEWRLEPCDPVYLQRGDPLVFEGEEGPTLGMFYLTAQHVIKQAETGILVLPRRVLLERDAIKRAWHL